VIEKRGFSAIGNLRDDQNRSLQRMVVQKNDNALPFREQDIEEAALPMR